MFEFNSLQSLSAFEAVLFFLTNKQLYFFLTLFIATCIQRQIGVQLFLVATFSLYFSHIVDQLHLAESFSDASLTLLPKLHDDVLILSIFFFYFIPYMSNRFMKGSSLLFVAFVSFMFIRSFSFPTYHIIATLVVSLFIIYMFYRSFDWIGAIPEQLKLLLIIVIAACLFLLSTEDSFLVGAMFATAFGSHLEQIKIGSKVKKKFSLQLLAFILSFANFFLIELVFIYVLHDTIFVQLLHGVMIGFLFTYVLPYLFGKLHIYEHFSIAKHR